MIKTRGFKPPGIYLRDIQYYTGFSDVKKACKIAGVELFHLNKREMAPLSITQTYKVLKVIRQLQGERFNNKLHNALSREKLQGLSSRPVRVRRPNARNDKS